MHKKIKIGEKEKKERKIVQTWKHKNFLLNKANHISIINQLFLNQSFDGDDTTKKELQKKLNSYKQQDIKKNKNKNGLIGYEELLEKLVISKLRCYYCKNETLLLYENNREQKQWTLDRLDNSCGHTKDNVVISCLKCNLERRCLNDDKFLFTKQMRLIKKN
jgi:hypothetical protein